MVEETNQGLENPGTNNTQNGFFSELRRELADLWQAFKDNWGALGVNLRNQLRRLRHAELDYVLLPISGSLPERDQPPRSFVQRQLPLPPLPLSMETLNRRLRAIADAPNVKGVVFIFQGLSAGLATLQNFRRAVERLRNAGKEVVVYTPYLDLPHYFAASAADRIVAPPSAEFTVLGLRTEVTYLKDALNQVGFHVDIVQISPYKTAMNPLGNAEMTPEEKEQLSWLLDEQFALLLSSMAKGRGPQHTVESLTNLINQAPFFAAQAVEHGLIDHVAYEDELPCLLAKNALEPAEDHASSSENANGTEHPKAKLFPWPKAAPLLLEKQRHRGRQFIGVVSLEGGIVMGPSRNPPIDLPIPFIGGAMAGEQTVIKLLRQAEQAQHMAALIFHVDSRGGSALASDLIAREVQRIGQIKPVLVYMGNVAASGGYYVSALAQHIMCQSGTFTGSIGVINGRLSSSDLLQKLHLNQVHLDRGERAGLFRNNAPMTDEERQIFWESIVTIYEQFKEVVSNGRSLPIEELDPICEGRVWSGNQALAHKLVDSHGDFQDAICQAAELANLPTDDDHTIPVHNFHPKDSGYLPAPPSETTALAKIGRMLLEAEWQKVNGRPLLLTPYELRLF